MRGVLPSWWDAHGQVRHAEVMVAVAEASALVLLSRQEGMARVGQEAMAVGTPIVVSPATGLGAWLTDGGGIVVEDPDDPDAVRAAIGEVMRDWQHHADRAREVARSWTWRDHAQGLLTCLSH
jgi:glycosyltransferase involved in cell wall biosynthesis